MDNISDDVLEYYPGDKVFFHYVDENFRSLRGYCKIIARHDVEGEPHYLVSASSDIMKYVGRLSPHIDDLGIVSYDEIEPYYVSFDLIVDNTVPKSRKKKRNII